MNKVSPLIRALPLLATFAVLFAVLTLGCGEGERDSGSSAGAGVAVSPHFVDVTKIAGISRVTWCGSREKDHLLESTGSGVAFLDLNGDGRDDIFVTNAWRLEDRTPAGGPRRIKTKGRFAYYENQGGGKFLDRTEESGLHGEGAWGCGVSAGDIDGDGDLDLYVSCFGANLLYRNLGDGRFAEVGRAAGVADPGWSGGAAFFDADGDGDLDLYVANYIKASMKEVLEAERTLIYRGKVNVMEGPFGLEGDPDRFYRNRGDGTFEEATEEVGLEDLGLGYGLGVLAADLDGDLDIDLYVANDSNPNYLFRNDGKGHFVEIGLISGAGFSLDGAAQAGMGIECADFNSDGILDVFVTNFSHDASTLYAGEGKLFFADISKQTGIATSTYTPLSWGTVTLDFDQNGLLDLIVANGHIYPQVNQLSDGTAYEQANLLLLNRSKIWENHSAKAGPGFQTKASFRGLAWGDLEGDGDQDLVLTRIDEPPLVLRQDGGDPSRRIIVAPKPHPWPRWIGARIDVMVGASSQSQVIRSGSSFASQNSLKAVFSLGDAPKADVVRVTFPGGGRKEYIDVPGGTTLNVPVPPPR